MKKLDLYILKKFLGTFFFAILLIISISVVFDVTEKVDNFIDKDAPLNAIIFDYYKNFIPYFANLFTPLFVFIAVIFFTSKMAYQTEIIAILSSGVSFRRMMFPYFMGAAIIAIFSFLLGGYVIPPANRTRLKFEATYVKDKREVGLSDIHMQIEPGLFVFLGKYYSYQEKGDYFNLEKYDEKQLISKLSARTVKFDTASGKWHLSNYMIREFTNDIEQVIEKGRELDTLIPNMKPADFKEERKYFEMMTNPELNRYINEQTARGVGNLEEFYIEKYKRIASPFSAFILTLIGVSLASRKVRGGMGLHIGVGIALSFSYILFMTISTTFAINGSMNPLLAVWVPNILFAIIGIFLYHKAPK
ncbi:LptF/LptG family permease [Carboxylicivirga linearis]|uniref:LptF/LptG family permease n=1 Tax=Carboxylicivirga linearis TaxID=1628157 RepID=A0ABS5JVZ9_9BACT|nr:LptF/LptG family permease [Carboxylicivirga linearis]MBS2098960.1 LptF/LptG family permease [Carboxylicivirga linearis]